MRRFFSAAVESILRLLRTLRFTVHRGRPDAGERFVSFLSIAVAGIGAGAGAGSVRAGQAGSERLRFTHVVLAVDRLRTVQRGGETAILCRCRLLLHSIVRNRLRSVRILRPAVLRGHSDVGKGFVLCLPNAVAGFIAGSGADSVRIGYTRTGRLRFTRIILAVDRLRTVQRGGGTTVLGRRRLLLRPIVRINLRTGLRLRPVIPHGLSEASEGLRLSVFFPVAETGTRAGTCDVCVGHAQTGRLRFTRVVLDADGLRTVQRRRKAAIPGRRRTFVLSGVGNILHLLRHLSAQVLHGSARSACRFASTMRFSLVRTGGRTHGPDVRRHRRNGGLRRTAKSFPSVRSSMVRRRRGVCRPLGNLLFLRILRLKPFKASLFGSLERSDGTDGFARDLMTRHLSSHGFIERPDGALFPYHECRSPESEDGRTRPFHHE